MVNGIILLSLKNNMEKKVWYKHGDQKIEFTDEYTWFCAKCDSFATDTHIFGKHKIKENIQRTKSDKKVYVKVYKPKGYETGIYNLFI